MLGITWRQFWDAFWIAVAVSAAGAVVTAIVKHLRHGDGKGGDGR
jgi:hypothetical protein